MKTLLFDSAPEVDVFCTLKRTLDDPSCEGLGGLVRAGCRLECSQHRGLKGRLVFFQIKSRLLVRDSPR